MNLTAEILSEFQQEAQVTRKHLAQVDFSHAEFQPHEKSEKMGRLAIHVAEIMGWWKNTLEENEMNFLGFEPENIENTPDLLAYFDRLYNASEIALKNMDAGVLDQKWSMKYGEEVLFTLPKNEVLRKFCMNHLIHHRAQLGVYLRLLDIDVPAGYGPSADDEMVTLTEPYR